MTTARISRQLLRCCLPVLLLLAAAGAVRAGGPDLASLLNRPYAERCERSA